MSRECAYLRSRALVARTLALHARDREVAALLIQVSEELEEEALLREQRLLQGGLDSSVIPYVDVRRFDTNG